ncbi:hypothetical protein DPMN_081289 [Dreissena polymorpha]|uniref:Uncharacterized protein n=1 Tax=Dreissena polymorpha TaxID=45954 RepID=A0A9D4BFS8_DREPO|nr:hypothetical protein DPMN_081289 [Dreissena polymorpha]
MCNEGVHVLKNTAETIGIFYPATPRGNDRIPVVFLPSFIMTTRNYASMRM